VPPALDTIELFNPTPSAVDVGGWFLSDDRKVPQKFRIPDGTDLASGGFLVFDESQFNAVPGGPLSFGLSSQGEEVWLFAADAVGNLTGYTHGFQFGASAPGENFGRYLTSAGEEQFPAQVAATFAATNAGPRVGPVVITEIHYHPAPGGDEFVELKNLTVTNVALFDPSAPTNTWRLAGLGFDFPTNVWLAPDESLLLVATNPVDFRVRYSLPPTVQVVGPWSGTLQNSGELLELQYPRPPYSNGVDYVTMDAVRYHDKTPWPSTADGGGPSLQRLGPAAYGDDAVNWTAAAPSPSSAVEVGSPPVLTLAPTNQVVIAGRVVTLAAAAEGGPTLQVQWQFNGEGIAGATQPQWTLTNVQPMHAGDYTFVAYNAAGATAAPPIRLTVLLPPFIVRAPQNTNVLAGSNAAFSVIATGTGELRYQWRVNGTDLAGETKPTLLVTNVQWNHEGLYAVQVTDDVASTLSAAAVLQIFSKPIILEQPQAQTAVQADTVTFSVRVAGTPPFAYRWRRGSTVIRAFGVGTQTLTLINVQASDAGNYNVSITNGAPGSSLVISANASLTVLADSDGDHVPDVWMGQYFGHTNGLAADQSRPQDDADGDWMLNWQEYRAGTNPTNAESCLRVGPLEWRSGQPAIRLEGVPGKRYGLEGHDGLGLNDWFTVTNVAISTTNTELWLNDRTATNTATRFYRLRLLY
jgi:hypothetical protein